MNLTRLGEAEAVDSLREVVDAHILRFAAILEEFLCRNTHSVKNLSSHMPDNFGHATICYKTLCAAAVVLLVTDQSDGMGQRAA